MKITAAKSSKHLLALPLGLIGIDFAVQTGASDPLNPVKFWILGILTAWVLADIATTSDMRNLVKNEKVIRFFIVLLSIFSVIYFVAFILTSVRSVGLLGDTGRNIGFLNYFFLSIVTLYASLKISFFNVKSLYWTVCFLLFIFSIYGIFQHFKLDFFNWNNQYNHVILTTGNPDFAASLLGLLVTLSFMGFFMDISKVQKLALIPLMTLAFVDIYWTQALQGLVASAAGIGFFLVVILWQKNIKFSLSLLGTELVIGFLAILGTLQVGPLTKYFFKASINDRGYDWRAAISMFKGHPLFGVGVDRYAAYFLQYRDPKYPLIYGYTQTVTNAHNVFLEIFATAGIFVGFAYLFIIGFIAYRGFFALRQTSGTEQIVIAAVISGWIVFVAQSVISVDSLVISIWGWVLGGSIVGLSLTKHEVVAPISGGRSPRNNGPKRIMRDYVSPYRSIAFVVFFTAISLIIVPMYRNETSTFRFSITQSPIDTASKDIYRSIAKKTFNLPLLNPNYKANIATTLAKNNYTPEAISYFKQTIKSDARNTNAYLLLSLIYEHLKNPQEAIELRKQLVILDPYGAENLVSLEADYIATGDTQAAVKTRDAVLAIAPGTDVAKRATALITK